MIFLAVIQLHREKKKKRRKERDLADAVRQLMTV